MAISKLNPTSTSLNSTSYTVPTAYKQYKVTNNYDAAVYTISVSPSSSVAKVFFKTASTTVEATTSSGSITVNLAAPATEVYISSNVDNDSVTITKTASALSGAEVSGTLDTITSSGTYNQTGLLYVLAVGGGGGGGRGAWDYSGDGGGASTPISKLVYSNGAVTVTIGSAGNGGANASPQAGNAGGTTNFGNLVSAPGGNGGAYGGQSAGNFGGGNGGSFNAQNAGTVGSATVFYGASIKSGTNGGGGGGGYNQSGAAGAGSGIGTGGAGGNGNNNTPNAGAAATGYGAGGGGGGTYSYGNQPVANGGAGSPGVVYVLRGF